MNFGQAFTYVFEDPDWAKKLLIPALVSLIPIIGQLVVLGWMLEVTRRVIQQNPRPLPELDFGRQLGEGFKGFIIGLVYALIRRRAGKARPRRDRSLRLVGVDQPGGRARARGRSQSRRLGRAAVQRIGARKGARVQPVGHLRARAHLLVPDAVAHRGGPLQPAHVGSADAARTLYENATRSKEARY